MELKDQLKGQWQDLVRSYSPDPGTGDELFAEIKEHYSAQGRYYHNLAHLHHLLSLLDEFRLMLAEPDTLAFAIWYHDLIYDPIRPHNEARSADVAAQRLHQLKMPPDKIQRVKSLILATHRHLLAPTIDDYDGRFFLDSDLSVLGASRETYIAYMQAIRQEYIMVPLAVYRNGREQVLQRLLDREHIFLTTELRERLEEQALSNIRFELQLLKGQE